MPAITCIKPTIAPHSPSAFGAPASLTKFLLNVDVLYSALAFVCGTFSACVCKCFLMLPFFSFFSFYFPSHFIYFWFFGFYMLHSVYEACLSIYLFARVCFCVHILVWLYVYVCVYRCYILLFDFLFQLCSTRAAVTVVFFPVAPLSTLCWQLCNRALSVCYCNLEKIYFIHK